MEIGQNYSLHSLAMISTSGKPTFDMFWGCGANLATRDFLYINDNVEITTQVTDDQRSYHISSEKIKAELNFESQHTLVDAVNDLLKAFRQDLFHNSLEDEIYFNIKRMQSAKLS